MARPGNQCLEINNIDKISSTSGKIDKISSTSGKIDKIINNLRDYVDCHDNDLRCKHAAIAIRNGKNITSPKINKWKHNVMGMFKGSQHAEVGAIVELFHIYCKRSGMSSSDIKTLKSYLCIDPGAKSRVLQGSKVNNRFRLSSKVNSCSKLSSKVNSYSKRSSQKQKRVKCAYIRY